MDVPEGWATVPFGHIFRRVKNPAGDHSAPYDILSVTKDGITLQSEHFNKQVASKDQSKYLLVRRGELVTSGLNLWLGGIDFQELVDCGLVSPAYKVFQVALPNADRRFLRHLMRSSIMMDVYRDVSQQGASIVRRNVDYERLDDSLLPLPPLAEQKKIAEILGSVDEAIQATQAVIDQTRKVKQGLLQQLLTRGIGHTRFKKTEIGEIPESWEVVTAQEMLDNGWLVALQDGNHGSQYPRKSEFSHRGLPYLAASNISDDGEIDLASCPRLPLARANDLRIPPAQGGDVILTHNATVGRVAMLATDAGTVVASTSTTYYRSQPAVLDRGFLAAYLASEVYQSQLQRIMGQSTRNQVPITAQRKLLLVKAPFDEQKRIADAFDQVRKTVLAARDEHQQVARLKAGLMSDLLSGRIRVQVKL